MGKSPASLGISLLSVKMSRMVRQGLETQRQSPGRLGECIEASQPGTVGKFEHKAVFRESLTPAGLWLLPQGHVGHSGQTDSPNFSSYQETD